MFDFNYFNKYSNKNILMMKKTTEDFIKKAIEIHGNKYDYSLVEYTGALNKVKIICPKHGIFEQLPNNHYKYDCVECGKEKTSKRLQKKLDKFILEAKNIHNDKYDYSKVIYKNNITKVRIICPEHGIFEQIPKNHIYLKYGCPKCSNNKKLTTEEFIKKSIEIHGNKYDYSITEYISSSKKIKIICPKHGIFEQRPNNHISKKYGCPYCNESHGEKEIMLYLEQKKIKYERQKTFIECKNKRKLPFDFYLPEYNICIEFDGEQHFREHKIWGNDKLIKTKINDKIKNEYCLNNNIRLIRIKFDENINEKLNLIK